MLIKARTMYGITSKDHFVGYTNRFGINSYKRFKTKSAAVKFANKMLKVGVSVYLDGKKYRG